MTFSVGRCSTRPKVSPITWRCAPSRWIGACVKPGGSSPVACPCWVVLEVSDAPHDRRGLIRTMPSAAKSRRRRRHVGIRFMLGLPPIRTRHIRPNGPLQISERLLERGRSFDVLRVHRLDGADAVDEREKVHLPGLVAGLRPLEGKLRLRDVSRNEQIALLECRAGGDKCLLHLSTNAVLDSSEIVSGC